MNTQQSTPINWSMDSMVEVRLKNPDNFLKVKETLTRIGIASNKDKILYQSCHILHKRGKYYIVHFKELFALDGKPSTLSSEDIDRRNTIANLLEDWGLVELVDPEKTDIEATLNTIKVLTFAEKSQWTLLPKYNLGKKRETVTEKE